MGAHGTAQHTTTTTAQADPHETVREREIAEEQRHLDVVYRRLEEKLAEAEYILEDAVKRVHVGTPGALAERDAQVYRAGAHLHRLNSEFEDFLFGRIDLQQADRPEEHGIPSQTPLDRDDPTIAETLHIGRIGVLDAEYGPLVIDWRAPAAAPFYRATPVEPGRVVRRRVIRSKGRRVVGVEDDLLRPDLPTDLAVVGDGALMAALGRARSHTMRDIVSSIQKEQDEVIRAPAAGATLVTGGPGTGKTAVALHRAAYLLYQDRRRYAGGILVVSPTPLLVAYTEGVLPSLGEEGQVAIRAVGNLVDGDEATTYDTPEAARIKGSPRMVQVLRRAARAALDAPSGSAAAPAELRVAALGQVLRLDAAALREVRRTALGGTTPVNLLRPRARRLLLDALWAEVNRHRPRPADRAERERRQEERESFDEYVTDLDGFQDFLSAWWPDLTPRRVLATLRSGRTLGRVARRVLSPEEVRVLAASWRRLGDDGRGALSAHDVALVDELGLLLGEPARPRIRQIDPADQLTGLDEVTTYADRMSRDRTRREGPVERTEYAHVIVDEAQDLTPMQWRMIGRRARLATWTIVGDPAQSSWPHPEEARAAMDEVLGGKPRRRYTLTTNYRNPAEIAEVAERVLALAAPGTPSPAAVRSTGVLPRFAAAPSVDGRFASAARTEVERLLAEVDGTVAVVVPMERRGEAAGWIAGLGDRAVALGSLEAKGLEYDATVVADPTGIAGESEAGLRVLYVALTRATQRLTVLCGPDDLPDSEGVPALLR
ncbi:HelD family protein [Peterkaempfera bronchialis]|uniref:HelD family protein n=1 Tax=Peterkaempfera bronchialis TaxID=2126346 RepID=UPI003C2ECD01